MSATENRRTGRLPEAPFCRANFRIADDKTGGAALGIRPVRATLLDMRVTIELPEPIDQILQSRAEQRGTSVQAVIVEAINKEIAHDPAPVGLKGRVSLPLIRSSRPGSLHSLTNAEIDDIPG
jgi:hypothetical protein